VPIHRTIEAKMVDEQLSQTSIDRRLIELAGAEAIPSAVSASALHNLTLMSLLMTDRDETDLLKLAAATVPTLTPGADRPSFLLESAGWWPARPAASVELEIAARSSGDGRPVWINSGWAGYVVPIRSADLHLGYVAVPDDAVWTDEVQFAVQLFARQLAVALDSARRHARERILTEELAILNADLADKVQRLGRILNMHERLTAVAATGGTQEIVETIADLTGRSILLENGNGTLRCTAGEVTRTCPRTREAGVRLLEKLRREPRPLRDQDWLVALAGHRSDSTTLLQMADPDRTAGEYENLVLEYAVAVLAIELARLNRLAESERQFRGEFLDDLLRGIPEESARTRAASLDLDLELARRIILVRPITSRAGASSDRLVEALEQACLRAGPGPVMTMFRGGEVICLVHPDLDWSQILRTVQLETGTHCRVAVGSLCRGIDEIQLSMRHARQAANLADRADPPADVTLFDSLGILRLLSLNSTRDDLDDYVREWLGALLDYGATNKGAADLVGTLRAYFRSGGSISGAASLLVLHENTVKYRLQRIGELTGRDLSDPETRFALQLAIHALEIGQAVRP
jgi:sugar diacid utilization regulator